MKKPKKRRVTITKDYLDNLKIELEETKKNLSNVRADRQKFRDYFVNTFIFAAKTNGEGKAINSEWYVKSLGQLLNRVEYWYWGQ